MAPVSAELSPDGVRFGRLVRVWAVLAVDQVPRLSIDHLLSFALENHTTCERCPRLESTTKRVKRRELSSYVTGSMVSFGVVWSGPLAEEAPADPIAIVRTPWSPS